MGVGGGGGAEVRCGVLGWAGGGRGRVVGRRGGGRWGGEGGR